MAITHRIRAVLGTEVVAVYLYGSAVVGGLRPFSDLDFFVVTRHRLTDANRHALLAAISPLSARRLRPAAWRPADVTSVALPEVRPWRYPPVVDLQLGEWLRADLDRGEIAPPASHPDLAVLLAMVTQHGVPLLGPPAAEVLPAVPRRDLRRAMHDVLDELVADLGDDTANVLLTLARIWSSLATGQFRSKDGAAEWAMEQLPAEHGSVFGRARAVYLGAADERWPDVNRQVRVAVDRVLSEVRST